MTIYSEKAVLLALSLCCFIHAVKYMVSSLISISVQDIIWERNTNTKTTLGKSQADSQE